MFATLQEYVSLEQNVSSAPELLGLMLSVSISQMIVPHFLGSHVVYVQSSLPELFRLAYAKCFLYHLYELDHRKVCSYF